MSACSVKTPEGTGVVKNGDYCYRGELSGGKYNGYGVLTFKDSIVYSGQWKDGKRDGLGQTTDSLGRTVTSMWRADSLVRGIRNDSAGIYIGEFNGKLVEEGHGIYFGKDGSFYNGNWKDGLYSGFGCSMSAAGKARTGEWKAGKFRGERLTYTAERIYGIDISRYQHGKGRKNYPNSGLGIKGAHNTPWENKPQESERNRRLPRVVRIHKVDRRHKCAQSILSVRLSAGTEVRHTLRCLPLLLSHFAGIEAGILLPEALALQQRRLPAGARRRANAVAGKGNGRSGSHVQPHTHVAKHRKTAHGSEAHTVCQPAVCEPISARSARPHARLHGVDSALRRI